MEYTLEGHGYAWSRVLRSRPSYLALPGEERRALDAEIDQIALMRGHTGFSPEHVEAPPELLASLHVRAPASPRAALALDVATSAKQVFDHLALTLDLRVTHCTFDETAAPLTSGADLILGVYSPTLTREVARDDSVAAGVIIALYGDGGGPGGGGALEVIPRIFRKVCENGAMIHLLDEAPLQIALHPSPARPRLREEIERRITAALDPVVFDVAVASFQAAAAHRLDHRGGELGAQIKNALPYDQWQAVMARYAADVWTRWGLANALTAEARWAPAFVYARRLERMGAAVACRAADPSSPLEETQAPPALAEAQPATDRAKVSAS
jgi:hypothetical protein